MTVTGKALWIIERNYGRDLTLDAIAHACGVSRFHLAHAFGQTTGQSVMHYVRGRRLTDAAQSLAAGAPDILQLALESGYGSHEAFTRAFRTRFGMAPETVRNRGALDGLPIVAPIALADAPKPAAPTPRLVAAGEIKIVGLPAHYSFAATHGIPTQWQRFMALVGDIPERLPSIPIGVASSIDEEGEFDYLCAVEVSAFSGTPRGLVQLRIPAQRYAVFEHTQHASSLTQTYQAIWDRWLTDCAFASADAPSIERHKATFDPRTGEGGVEIWIPVVA